MNLKRLLEDDVITKETFDWLKPLHDTEEADLEEIRTAAEERKSDPFYQIDSDDDEDEENMLTTTTNTLHYIEDTDAIVVIVTDTNSTGHGNKVWHASIATCRYLKELVSSKKSFTKRNRFFHSLELGAGTAVPSFFLAQLMMTKTIDHMNKGEAEELMMYTVNITDAKQYRNIKQILMSVGLQQAQVQASTPMLGADSNIEFKVHPHNWGEFKDDDLDSFDKQSFDLVIVSDCIYNPEHHDALLDSLARTLALPRSNERCRRMGFEENEIGGRAMISFSLHGNVDDDKIWNFIEHKIPSKRCPSHWESGDWLRLNARCVSTTPSSSTSNSDSSDIVHSQQENKNIREGWNMEDTMTKLEMVTEGMKPERWLAYVYEITWVKADDDDEE